MYMKPENIFAQIAEAGEEEQFDLLFKSPNCRIDRIVSLQSDAQIYKQAGNGVTVHVVEAIGKRLALAHREVNAID